MQWLTNIPYIQLYEHMIQSDRKWLALGQNGKIGDRTLCALCRYTFRTQTKHGQCKKKSMLCIVFDKQIQICTILLIVVGLMCTTVHLEHETWNKLEITCGQMACEPQTWKGVLGILRFGLTSTTVWKKKIEWKSYRFCGRTVCTIESKLCNSLMNVV